jgi:perosamine synthetase
MGYQDAILIIARYSLQYPKNPNQFKANNMNYVINPSKYLGNELEYLKRVLEGESWSSTGGSWTNSLEKEFANKFGVKYAVAFNSGTSTMHAALEAAGVGPGDEVISPAITVIMNTTATIHANAVPVYADVDPDTFNIDPNEVEKKITPKTKAIIPVSLYGLPPDMDSIMDIAKRHHLIVIEDNAQCVLSTYKGRLAGTIGHMASYSFENTKHISCGEGGMIITDNENYAEAVRKIGGHGFKNLRATEGRIRLNQDIFQDPDYKRHDVLGWNYRLSEFNAAVALAQLERVESLVDLRIGSAEIFMDAMSSCNYLIPQRVPHGYTNSYYTLGVKYEGEAAIGVSWQAFRRAYIEAGGDGIYGAWSVPYMEPVVKERQFVSRCPWVYQDVQYHKGSCPVAESIQPKIMQFKTNYRDIELAKSKATVLKKVIKQFSA